MKLTIITIAACIGGTGLLFLGIYLGTLKSRVRILEQNILINELTQEILRLKPEATEALLKLVHGMDPKGWSPEEKKECDLIKQCMSDGAEF